MHWAVGLVDSDSPFSRVCAIFHRDDADCPLPLPLSRAISSIPYGPLRTSGALSSFDLATATSMLL